MSIQPDPLKLLVDALPQVQTMILSHDHAPVRGTTAAIPVRAAEAGRDVASVEALMGRLDAQCQFGAGPKGALSHRDRKSRDEVRAAVEYAVQAPDATPEARRRRITALAMVLEFCDHIEGDDKDFRAEAAREMRKLRRYARAAKVAMRGIDDWARNHVTGLPFDEAFITLRELRSMWVRDEVRLRRHRAAPSTGGRPSRLLTRDAAVPILQACGLTDRIARLLFKAASR